MDETEPTKITVRGGIRWAFGFVFALLFALELAKGNLTASILLLLAALISIPLTSNIIESKMNISMSGASRFVIVIFLVIISSAFTVSNTPSNPTDDIQVNDIPETNANVAPTVSDSEDGCNYDWTYTISPNVGSYYNAPDGFSYLIVDLYIKNNGDQTISTNPFSWKLTADGIIYQPDTATFDQSIGSQSVEVGKGGEKETKIVYLVKGVPDTAILEYGGLFGPDLKRIKHY